MSDFRKNGEPPSTAVIAKQGIIAIVCAAGGIFLFVLQMVSRFRVLGLIVGTVICVAGIVSMLSKDSTDSRAGLVVTVTGVLTLLSKIPIPPIQTAAGTLLCIGAMGLLALGVWNGIKFFTGLQKRA